MCASLNVTCHVISLQHMVPGVALSEAYYCLILSASEHAVGASIGDLVMEASACYSIGVAKCVTSVQWMVAAAAFRQQLSEL